MGRVPIGIPCGTRCFREPPGSAARAKIPFDSPAQPKHHLSARDNTERAMFCNLTLHRSSGPGERKALRRKRPARHATETLGSVRKRYECSRAFPSFPLLPKLLHPRDRGPSEVCGYTNPENPMKAIARIPAVTNATGIPCMALGIFSNSSRSRIPAKMTSARANPAAVAIE